MCRQHEIEAQMLDLIFQTAKVPKSRDCRHVWFTDKPKHQKMSFKDYDVIYVVDDR